ncbi:MAG: hypothetical protein O3A85_04600 [Proteobacteria bacterium]|nr:hypothetical protein [Pseudomonadota bacterium]
MLNNEGLGYGMTDIDIGPWYSGMLFHGGLSLIFLALVVIALVMLIRDYQRDDGVDAGDETSQRR